MEALKLFPLYIALLLTLSHSASDVELILQKLKPSLKGDSENFLLSTWNASVPLCQWRGLKWAINNGTNLVCTDLSSPQWTSLSLYKDPFLHLISVRLPSANLSGILPREIGEFSNLESLYLGVNALSGTIPLELGYSSSLSDIDLSHNLLSGSLPTSIWNLCDRLVSLRLHGNSLSGSLPDPALPVAICKDLHFLDLGQNTFSGNFPEFITRFDGLKELDLGNNMYSGPIPESITGLKLDKLNLSHNNFSGVLPKFEESKFGVDVFEGNSPTLCGQPLRSCGGSSGLSSGAIAGIVIGLMTGAVVLVSLLIGYFQGKKRKSVDEEEELEEGEDGEEGGGGGEGKLVMFQGGEHLTLEDVLNATGQLMEKTSYGTAYKAKLADGGTIALRLLKEESRVGKPVLNWARRHKIALGIAKGLAHLHGLETPITHGNVRSKNVLVDDFFVARLNEFGLDKIMIPSVADEIVAQAKTDGYKAPELQKMKKCNSRTDVYAYGILLLEILLGKRPGKNGVNGEFVDLPSLVKVAVLEEATMEVFDVELLKATKNPMEEGLVHALKLAMGCCAPVASVRPTMDEVARQLEENRPRNRSAIYSPAETRSGSGTPF
ncbi:unnamed protein product [Fraxinus pennsylvanica]|uniref:Serine-threonine/tyrosine-protein kinase catalytic domain-containing protein n=1 Tax=Fraxinus pennsylvanica TaxID=56036 RepID=A0AAD1ZXW9_9LAMI|nr:unnamed protein product [Fraxinus pennsylvanica]